MRSLTGLTERDIREIVPADLDAMRCGGRGWVPFARNHAQTNCARFCGIWQKLAAPQGGSFNCESDRDFVATQRRPSAGRRISFTQRF